MPQEPVLRQRLQTPRAAGIAGVVFAAITIFEMSLSRLGGPDSGAFNSWLADPAQHTIGRVALNLVPFAGIAFLWFIGVVRSRIGNREDRLFATVFLGSGLVYISTMFVAAGILGSAIALYPQGAPAGNETVDLANVFAGQLIGSFSLRMAGVFVLSATTLGYRTGALPRWLAILGWLTALMLIARCRR